jgi:AraC-like DNA-binding protein
VVRGRIPISESVGSRYARVQIGPSVNRLYPLGLPLNTDCTVGSNCEKSMQRNVADPLQRVINHADIRLTGSVKCGYGQEGELLKRVLDSLTDCQAELVTLNSPWARRVPGGWFYVYFIRSGTCQLTQGSFTKPLRIQSGDTVILPQCREHRLHDSHTTDWSDSNHISWFDHTPRSNAHRVLERDHPDTTNILVCRFSKPSRECNRLIDKLPEYLVCRRHEAEPTPDQESIIEVLGHEVAQHPMCQPIVEHLVKVLILQATRCGGHRLSTQQSIGHTELADSVIARALALMRSRPEVNWTVATLATAVGVSRSTFAARFVDQIGITPLNYLRGERMRQAVELLRDESLGIKEVAILVGYRSESAFSSTFKQWSGMTPAFFRRDRRQ